MKHRGGGGSGLEPAMSTYRRNGDLPPFFDFSVMFGFCFCLFPFSDFQTLLGIVSNMCTQTQTNPAALRAA